MNNEIKNSYYKLRTKTKKLFILLSIVFFVLFTASLFVGRYFFISPLKIFHFIIGTGNITKPEYNIVFMIRLPRIILVSIVGMALSVSGHVYQNMFRNPLVSPNILGVSAGCSFGAALGIILPLYFPYSTEVFAFMFGLLAVFITYSISKAAKHSPVLLLILGGIVVSSFFNSLLSFLQYIADPYKELPDILYWIMGGFSETSWNETLTAGIVIIPIMFVIMLLSHQLNLLSLGDEDAKSLGLEVNRLRFVFIILTTIMVAIAVSVSGSIAWIGLIIPHITRSIVGVNNQISIPVSMLIGACCLLFADNIARTLTSNEIPIGILISFVGAPFFAYLLIMTKRRGFHES